MAMPITSGQSSHSSYGGRGLKALEEQKKQGGGRPDVPYWASILFPQFTGFINPEQTGEAWFGSPERIHELENYEPSQWEAIMQALQTGQNQIQNPYQGFEPIEQQYTNQFNQQVVPGLAERFSSLGSNATSSPAFSSQLGQAGAGLSQGLAALKSQYGMQNREQGANLLGNIGLKQRYTPMQQAAQPGFFNTLANAGVKYATAGMM